MTTIKNRCQEWGIVNSHFLHGALQFDIFTALKEKIDNSYSAGAKCFIIGKYEKFFFLYDDMGMSFDELDDYINLYRAPPNQRPTRDLELPSIGKHGLGGKEADCILSSKGACNILSTNNGKNFYKINMNYKIMFDDISNNVNNPWSKNMKIEETNLEVFTEFLTKIGFKKKKTGTLFLYHNNDIFDDILDLNWKLGLHYEDLIDNKFEILYYNKTYTKVSSYSPIKPSFVTFPKNKHPRINYAEIEVPIYCNSLESEFYVKDLRFMDKRINLKWNRINNRCVHCKNSKCIPDDVLLIGNFTFKISALMELSKEDKDLVQKKEIEYFGKQLYGCRIKRLGVQTGNNCWLPNSIRKNENMWIRCSLSYELGSEGDFDIFFEPGINKSQITPKNLIHNLVKELFLPFRNQFPKHQKDDELIDEKEENNYSELESFSDSEFDKSESESDSEEIKKVYNHDNTVFIKKNKSKNSYENIDLLSDESSELSISDENISDTASEDSLRKLEAVSEIDTDMKHFIKKIESSITKDRKNGLSLGSSLLEDCYNNPEPVDFNAYLQELNSMTNDLESQNLRIILLNKCFKVMNRLIL